MTPTLTNTPIGTTLFIIFLCIVGMYLSIQLSKAKKQSFKNRLKYLSEKSAKKNIT